MREMNDQIWNQRIKPVQKWLENFKSTDEDEEEYIEGIKMNLHRGNRRPDKRGGILKQWETEFSNEIQNGNELFADWWPIHRHTNTDPKKCGLCRQYTTKPYYREIVEDHKKIVEFVDSHEVMACEGCDQLYTLDKSEYWDGTTEILPIEQLDGQDCCPSCGDLPTPQVMNHIDAFFENYWNAIDYQCTKSSCSRSISTLGEAFGILSICISEYQLWEYMDIESTSSFLSKLQKDDDYWIIQFTKDLIKSYATKEGDNDLLFCECCLDGDFDPEYFD